MAMASTFVTVPKPFINTANSSSETSRRRIIVLDRRTPKVVLQADRVIVRLEELPEILSLGTDVGGNDIAPGKKVDLGTDSKHCFYKAGDLLAVVE